MTRIYVNAATGNDALDGKTPGTAWKTLAKASEYVFEPGDALLLARGSVWQGEFLAPKGTGSEKEPVMIEPYGEGARPAIHTAGTHIAAVDLLNTEGWEVRGLEITNKGPERAAVRYGLLARLMDYGTARHIVFEDNEVHDVNGSVVKADGETNGGIAWRAEGREVLSRYIGLEIRNNHIVTCDRVGIFGTGSHIRQRWFPCLDVVIYGNVLEDIGGDGILNIGTDGCVIERNRLLGGRIRDDRYCAGIWPWGSDNTIIRYNEAAYYRGMRDGQGFDCDFNCVGTVHEYNYSHDNDGGFMLVCSPLCTGEHMRPENIGCVNSWVRRNLSVNDKTRIYELCGEIIGTRIEENYAYTGKDIDVGAVVCSCGYGQKNFPQQVLFSRNVFACDGIQRFGYSETQNEDGSPNIIENPGEPLIRYSNNVFAGTRHNDPADPGLAPEVPTMEAAKAIFLDENGQAKPGLETLDAFLDLMGWPKSAK